MSDLPRVCGRCHEEILDGQETEMMPFIPRWNWSVQVHKGCEFKINPWVVMPPITPPPKEGA